MTDKQTAPDVEAIKAARYWGHGEYIMPDGSKQKAYRLVETLLTAYDQLRADCERLRAAIESADCNIANGNYELARQDLAIALEGLNDD